MSPSAVSHGHSLQTPRSRRKGKGRREIRKQTGRTENPPFPHHHQTILLESIPPSQEMDPKPKRSIVKSLFWPSRRLHVIDPQQLQQQQVDVEGKDEEEEEDEEDEKKKLQESSLLLAKLFAGVSAIKAAYARLQIAETPYDPEAVQSADLSIVSELKRISHLKHAYLSKHLVVPDVVGDAQVVEEIHERKNLLNAFLVTTHKLESELEAKTSEVRKLAAHIQQLEEQRKGLEVKLHPKRSLSAFEDLHFSGLTPTHFLIVLRHTVKSIRSFVDLMVTRMAASGWDLNAVAACIIPNMTHENATLAFESFVSHAIFSDFQQTHFGILDSQSGSTSFFDEFLKARRTKASRLLEVDGVFRSFCKEKYGKVVSPKMEHALLVDGDRVQEGFLEMARHVWMLHMLFFSFSEGMEMGVFKVRRGSRFSEVYMESVGEGVEGGTVGFTVVPGFRIGRTVIQCKVYLVGS